MNELKFSNEITLIAAASENNALGKDNQLIWHISEDLKRFKKLTQGHAIIMGRKTFESMPKALPDTNKQRFTAFCYWWRTNLFTFHIYCR